MFGGFLVTEDTVKISNPHFSEVSAVIIISRTNDPQFYSHYPEALARSCTERSVNCPQWTKVFASFPPLTPPAAVADIVEIVPSSLALNRSSLTEFLDTHCSPKWSGGKKESRGGVWIGTLLIRRKRLKSRWRWNSLKWTKIGNKWSWLILDWIL